MLYADPQHDFRANNNSAGTSSLSWHDGVGPIAIFFALLLHVSVVVIMTVGIPFLPEPKMTEITNIVAVEFVEIAENTESDREVSRAKNEDEKTSAAVKKPDVKPNVEAKAEKPKPRSAPTVDAKSQPLTVSKDKNNESDAPPPTDVVPLPEELKIEKPEKNLAPIKPKKPNKRPKKPEPKAVKEEKSFDSVLKNLQETENTQAAAEEGEQAQSAAPKTPTLGQRITVSELDALRGQLAECWNVLAGANFDHALVVYIKLYMNPDRTVRRYEIKDQLRYTTDSFFRAAADAAARAVNNPSCSPLKLPAGKYDQWKVITVKFDPREML
tara:strand:+ start:186712 stop:187692 length:981 start_codon:yes stop_codon:yes gene_type:complete